ncbi:MAG: hypothetical protein ACRD12_01650 [Acidimicrobiales bacterium]
MTDHGKPRRRRPGDEVLEAIDALLLVLRDSAQRNKDAARQAQSIRRLRSHGRSYAEILGRNLASSAHRITQQSLEATVLASERLKRAEIRALRTEGLGVDRIASLCGLTPASVEGLIAEGPA